MSSDCGIRQVESQARAYYVTQFTYKSQKSTDLIYSLNRVSYVHSPRTTDESLHCSVLPFQLIFYSRIETARHLVRSDFWQRSTQTLKYVVEFP